MLGTKVVQLNAAQLAAQNALAGLISNQHIRGRTLACLVGVQGSGKTTLAKTICLDSAFAPVQRIAANQLLIDHLASSYPDLLTFPNNTFVRELKRFGQRLRQDIYQVIRSQMLDEGLTIIDHLELLFALGMNPVTSWYNDAVGKRRVLLVITGRMAGARCQVGQITLTRADQPIVELEAVL